VFRKNGFGAFELGIMVVSEMCVAIPSLNINEKIKM
jgi:hypothetical protein